MSQSALGTAIYAALTGNATMAALVGTRVYPLAETPANPVRPYLTYRRISQIRDNAQNGAIATHAAARVQMDVYAATQSDIDAACDALRTICNANSFTGGLRRLAWDGGPVDMPEYEEGADQASPHVAIDLLATYKEQ
jgi:hypothetical protein